MPPEEAKALYKEALKEWLNDQFAVFGKWSAAALASIILAGLVYFAMIGLGWHR